MALYYGVSTAAGLFAYPKLSNEIRMKAVPDYKFRQLVRRVSEYGKEMGDTIYFTKASYLNDRGRAIGERDAVPTTGLTVSRDSLTVQEFSNSLEYTRWLEDLVTLDINEVIKTALADDMARTIDEACGTVFRTADIVYTPTGSITTPTYSVVSTGTPTATSSRKFNVWDLDNVLDFMRTIYLMPEYGGRGYVCIASPNFIRGLREDEQWQREARYYDPSMAYAGEIGEFRKVRFIEDVNLLDNSLPGGAGEAIFVADDAVIEGQIYPETIEARQNTEYGRVKALRWVWGGGFKKTWDYATDGQARLLRVYSA